MGNAEATAGAAQGPEPGADGGGRAGFVPGENLRVVLLRMIHEASQQMVEEATGDMEQRLRRRADAAARDADERLRRLEEAMRSLQDSVTRCKGQLDKELQRLERLETARRAEMLELAVQRDQDTAGAQHPLEARVVALEESVQRALQTVLPRVEKLIEQLDEREAAAPASGARSSILSTHDTQAMAESGALGAALKAAAQEGRAGDVTRLLDAGADVDARDAFGLTALHWAARRGQTDALALLIKRGADVHTRDNYGWTPLHTAAKADRRLCLRLLLGAGADHARRDANGWTALHWAAAEDSEGAVQALLAAGADPRAQDNFGMLPLDLAASDAVTKLLRT